MRPRFGPRKPHPVPGVRPDTSNPTAPFCGSEGPACGLPSTSEALCHRPLAGRQRSRMGCRYRHSLWGCLLRRLRHEPVSPLTLTALSLGPFSGWRPARKSLTAMEPKPPVPVSSTRKHHRRTKSESQDFFFVPILFLLFSGPPPNSLCHFPRARTAHRVCTAASMATEGC